MAQGRFVSKSISTNEELASVSLEADFFFARCIPHLDVEGRITGNPALLKSQIFPLRPEITEASIPRLIEELAGAYDERGRPLVLHYQVRGKRFLWFPGFADQQLGLRKDREATSKIPAPEEAESCDASAPEPLPDTPRRNSGATPELVRSEAGTAPPEVEVQGEVEEKPKSSAPVGAATVSLNGNGEHQPRRRRRAPDPELELPVSWSSQACQLWQEIMKGVPPGGEIGHHLKRLIDQGHPVEEVLERWGKYLRMPDDPRYKSAAKFAQTYGTFDHPPPPRSGAFRDICPRDPVTGELVAPTFPGVDDDD